MGDGAASETSYLGAAEAELPLLIRSKDLTCAIVHQKHCVLATSSDLHHTPRLVDDSVAIVVGRRAATTFTFVGIREGEPIDDKAFVFGCRKQSPGR